MAPRKVTRKKNRKSSKKIPKTLLDISVKKSMKEANKINPSINNLFFSLIRLKQKYNNFDLIINKLDCEIYIYKNKTNINKKFIKRLKNLVDNYSSKKKRFIILPVGIIISDIKYYFFKTDIGHENIIIIDLKDKKAEYFEPHGALYSKNFNKLESIKNKDKIYKNLYKNSKKIYLELKPIFKKLKLKFILPHQYLDKYDFQNVESVLEIYDKTSSQRKEDLPGYCLVWCLWFVSLRLKYPDTDLKELVKSAKSILKNDYTYRNFIRNYAKDIYIKNNKLLKENKISIDLQNYRTFNRVDDENKKKVKKLVEKHFTSYK